MKIAKKGAKMEEIKDNAGPAIIVDDNDELVEVVEPVLEESKDGSN